MQLSRTIITTPIGDMLALSSDEGLCALEFTTVDGPSRGQERLTRLNARLGRWFPPHEIVDGRRRPSPARAAGSPRTSTARPPRSATCRSTCAARRSRSACGPRSRRSRPARRPATGRSRGRSTPPARRARSAPPTARTRWRSSCRATASSASSGSLTGYGGGLDRKTWLIEHERRWRHDPQASLF